MFLALFFCLCTGNWNLDVNLYRWRVSRYQVESTTKKKTFCSRNKVSRTRAIISIKAGEIRNVKCRHVFELDNGINQQSSNVYAHSAEFQFCRVMEAPAWMGKCPYMIYCCRLQWKDILDVFICRRVYRRATPIYIFACWFVVAKRKSQKKKPKNTWDDMGRSTKSMPAIRWCRLAQPSAQLEFSDFCPWVLGWWFFCFFIRDI